MRWKHVRIALLCVLSGAFGCNEVIDTGRFSVSDGGRMDGGAMDGGAMDAGIDAGDIDGGGPDACAGTVWYRDSDMDTFGDPDVTMLGCTQPDGYVANADDCDDSTDTIAPGVSEVCDDTDQDCDGAVDEGLFGPLGTLIPIVSDLGFTNSGADIVATRDGVTVVWRREDENFLRATFLARDGTELAASVYIAGGTGPVVRLPTATRFTSSGLDSTVIAWAEADGVHGRVCDGAGACAAGRDYAVGIDGTAIRGIALAQLGSRIVLYWRDDVGQHLRSIDPLLAIGSTVVTLPLSVDSSGLDQILTVMGATPHTLVTRVAEEVVLPDGGVPIPGRVEILRVDGESALTWSAASAFEWDIAPRCPGGTCTPFALALTGNGASAGEPSAMAFESIATLDSGGSVATVCALPLTPQSTGLPILGPCVPLPSSALYTFHAERRGTLITTVIQTATGYALREIPLASDAAGAPATSVTIGALSFLGGPEVGVRGSHGGLLGDTDAASTLDLAVEMLGCTP